ncbi:hypothetical protein BU23DRAFT_560406 [Bimuria novae-zelandiae CBS 107.79]|uniref:Uncharacterized protein n=1 Tax=Bimuria novae-zelandiae CBS 107.79 TaxID=1447943 RepID=A0A6A5UNF1_9PLEO|nr:hypothetical protein BU23DRAFT_560406 [Bimuria novae-zelandiae CBS 107.79]
MSTTYLTIYDLLRITYMYEARALAEVDAQSCSRSPIASLTCITPELCKTEQTSPPYEALETDFTPKYARNTRHSCVSMT